MKYVIFWHGKYVCGAPPAPAPVLTTDPVDAYWFVTRKMAQEWLDAHYVVGDPEIRVEERS